jgi:hypothetical protein
MGGKERTPFYSIGRSLWWVVVTITTVGYGDYYPTSTIGKFLGVVTMCCAVLMMALPITIIGNEFTEEYAIMHGDVEAIQRRANPTGRMSDDSARNMHSGSVDQEPPGPMPTKPNGMSPGEIAALHLTRQKSMTLLTRSNRYSTRQQLSRLVSLNPNSTMTSRSGSAANNNDPSRNAPRGARRTSRRTSL